MLLLSGLEGALSAECGWGGLWARAAKVTFLIKNSRYKTGMREHRRSGFTFPHVFNAGVRGQGPVDAEADCQLCVQEIRESSFQSHKPSLQESTQREVKTGHRSILRNMNRDFDPSSEQTRGAQLERPSLACAGT